MCLLVDRGWVQTADAVFRDGEQAWEEHLRSCCVRNRLTQVRSQLTGSCYLLGHVISHGNKWFYSSIRNTWFRFRFKERRNGSFFCFFVFLNVRRRQRCWIISKGKLSQLVFTVDQTSVHPTSHLPRAAFCWTSENKNVQSNIQKMWMMNILRMCLARDVFLFFFSFCCDN